MRLLTSTADLLGSASGALTHCAATMPNAIPELMLKLAAWFVPGFAVRGFWPALLGGAILSVLSLVVRRLLHQ